jgi:predicted Zn-dependent peptidase
MHIHRLHRPGLATTAMIAFPAGSTAENADEWGLAHFLEHMVFKGGQTYLTYREVNRTAASLGAELNACTSDHWVAFFITARAANIRPGLGLLSDFVGRPTLPEDQFEQERAVILQELAQSRDDPESLADTCLRRALYGDHRCGTDIIGSKDSIQALSREQMIAFRDRTWHDGVLLLVGDLDTLGSTTFDHLTERLPTQDTPEQTVVAAPVAALAPRREILTTDTEQSHLRLGFAVNGVDMQNAQQRAALAVYTGILGGGMASRLFEALREERGLCYSIYAYEWGAADLAPVVGVSADLDCQQLDASYQLITAEVAKLATGDLHQEEFVRAKTFTASRYALRFQNTENIALNAAETLLAARDDLIDPEAIVASFDRVSLADVQAIAERIALEPSIGLVGPHHADALR